jgi:hypothetical protein
VLLTFPGSGRRDRQILRVKGSTCSEVKMTSIESGYAQHYGSCGDMIPRKAVKGHEAQFRLIATIKNEMDIALPPGPPASQ